MLCCFADAMMYNLWLLVISTRGPCIALNISARLLLRRVMLQQRATFEAESQTEPTKCAEAAIAG